MKHFLVFSYVTLLCHQTIELSYDCHSTGVTKQLLVSFISHTLYRHVPRSLPHQGHQLAAVLRLEELSLYRICAGYRAHNKLSFLFK